MSKTFPCLLIVALHAINVSKHNRLELRSHSGRRFLTNTQQLYMFHTPNLAMIIAACFTHFQ